MTDRDRARRIPARERALCALLSGACVGVLAVASGLAPDDRGLGTHTQLGLPPCPWDTLLDMPCATCGMTTSFALASHARFADAFLTQPLGALLAVGAAMVFWIGLHSALTGSQAVRILMRAVTGRSLIWLGIATLAAWGYKVWAQAPA